MGLAAILVFGAALLVYGINAYRGAARGWTLRGGYLGLGALYFGAAILLSQPVTWLLESGYSLPGILLGLVMTVCMVLLVLSFFWMPAFLKPRWLKDWEARGSDRTEFSPFRRDSTDKRTP
ncbi:hypothetical protein D477_019061 [Arthrobacter crystallopoietes BAB-32]|uniref:Uncharacterized protein n=1 Tax=Arthrobacter crystallopoietes BAB-32 TaxID=1246476 RepID=N1UUD4_9MICC|nr:hypothetical protein [Arthrobacter crystallopoietes]EMY32660.1 hypothetical protein D477_019061 [Arthrobacter crystallopoietes BAB-32]